MIMVYCHKGKSSEKVLDKEAILRALRIIPGQTILDAGCGNGYMAKEFARALKGRGRVYALDADGEAIARLRTETQGTIIEPIEGNVTKRTPLQTSSIDLVYLSTVFHGFSTDEIPGFQAEASRLLKPHARLAIVEIQKRETPFGPPLDIRFSPDELKRAVRLLPLETVDVGPYFYMQLFENCWMGEEDDGGNLGGHRTPPST
jgi:ubiquinone/menaquinone biosynthesis C-methylase UbiE